MRKYYTESVGSLLKKMKKEMKWLELAKAQEELKSLWASIPDATLKRLTVSFKIDQSGILEISSTSTVANNYLKRQKPLIEKELSSFMNEHSIKELRIS